MVVPEIENVLYLHIKYNIVQYNVKVLHKYLCFVIYSPAIVQPIVFFREVCSTMVHSKAHFESIVEAELKYIVIKRL